MKDICLKFFLKMYIIVWIDSVKNSYSVTVLDTMYGLNSYEIYTKQEGNL